MSGTDLVAPIVFIGIAACALRVGSTSRATPRHRRRARELWLIGAVLMATMFAGVSGVDLWPVSSWALMTGTPTRTVGDAPIVLQVIAVDAAGREYPVDYRAVEPFAFEEWRGWMRAHFAVLSREDRDRVAGWMLSRLNVARERVRAGRPPGTQGRWLGPLRAPFHGLHPAAWSSPEDVPATPFVMLRLYREWWDLAERARDPSAVRRVRDYEFTRGTPP